MFVQSTTTMTAVITTVAFIFVQKMSGYLLCSLGYWNNMSAHNRHDDVTQENNAPR